MCWDSVREIQSIGLERRGGERGRGRGRERGEREREIERERERGGRERGGVVHGMGGRGRDCVCEEKRPQELYIHTCTFTIIT
jgi:hypothetical protein